MTPRATSTAINEAKNATAHSNACDTRAVYAMAVGELVTGSSAAAGLRRRIVASGGGVGSRCIGIEAVDKAGSGLASSISISRGAAGSTGSSGIGAGRRRRRRASKRQTATGRSESYARVTIPPETTSVGMSHGAGRVSRHIDARTNPCSRWQ